MEKGQASGDSRSRRCRPDVADDVADLDVPPCSSPPNCGLMVTVSLPNDGSGRHWKRRASMLTILQQATLRRILVHSDDADHHHGFPGQLAIAVDGNALARAPDDPGKQSRAPISWCNPTETAAFPVSARPGRHENGLPLTVISYRRRATPHVSHGRAAFPACGDENTSNLSPYL